MLCNKRHLSKTVISQEHGHCCLPPEVPKFSTMASSSFATCFKIGEVEAGSHVAMSMTSLHQKRSLKDRLSFSCSPKSNFSAMHGWEMTKFGSIRLPRIGVYKITVQKYHPVMHVLYTPLVSWILELTESSLILSPDSLLVHYFFFWFEKLNDARRAGHLRMHIWNLLLGVESENVHHIP